MSDIKDLRVGQYDNAKKIMYLAKEMLLASEKINISATTNSSPIAARAAETLQRLGYITYENIKTETFIERGKRIRFVITIKKTSNFEKLYKENEEFKKKKDEERKAQEAKK
jgi:hypothetical protein